MPPQLPALPPELVWRVGKRQLGGNLNCHRHPTPPCRGIQAGFPGSAAPGSGCGPVTPAPSLAVTRGTREWAPWCRQTWLFEPPPILAPALFCLQSLINSLKKGPELLKWFPTCPRPQRRRPAQPPTPPARGSPPAPRTPSSPCELVCGWLPDGRSPVPAPIQAPATPPSQPLSPPSCTAVSTEMPLCLLPGLPPVRAASGRWDSCGQRP